MVESHQKSEKTKDKSHPIRSGWQMKTVRGSKDKRKYNISINWGHFSEHLCINWRILSISKKVRIHSIFCLLSPGEMRWLCLSVFILWDGSYWVQLKTNSLLLLFILPCLSACNNILKFCSEQYSCSTSSHPRRYSGIYYRIFLRSFIKIIHILI